MSEDEDIEIIDEDAGVTGKITKIRKELEVCRSEKEEYLAGWQRAKADYINAGRTLGERLEDSARVAKTGVLHQFLEIVDSIEQALADPTADSQWATGVRLTYEKCIAMLKQHGVEAIELVDKTFDPRYHEAVDTILADKIEDDHKIAEEFQKGYTISGRVLRPTKVKVYVYNK